MKKYNWGILGCGGIAGRFAQGLTVLEQAVIKGAASRTLDKAKNFCAEFGVEKPYGSYEDMAKDPEIDIVYIATPHNLHYENALLCLQHDKHVLCEKSFTVNAKQAQQLVGLAKEKKLFLMEAMWTRFLPINVKVRELLAEKTIGEASMLHANLGFPAKFDPQWRLFNKNLAGGAILDVGVYPISYADMVFGCEPEKISGEAYIGSTGVDETSCYTTSYGNGRYAVMSSSLRSNLKDEAVISGNLGYIRVPCFHHPEELFVKLNDDKEETRMGIPFQSTGYNYEAQEAMECLDAGKTESSIMPLADTLRIMRTMDTLRNQWGLAYPGE